MKNTEIQSNRNWVKRIAVTALVGAAVLGTYSGRKNDLPPVYSNKTGNSYGINLSLFNSLPKEATFYGINLGIVNNDFGKDIDNLSGKIYGANIGVVNSVYSKGELNGLEIGLINVQDGRKSIPDLPRKVNGLQIGLANSASSGNVVQIGIANRIKLKDGTQRFGIILNYAFEGGDSK